MYLPVALPFHARVREGISLIVWRPVYLVSAWVGPTGLTTVLQNSSNEPSPGLTRRMHKNALDLPRDKNARTIG